MLDLYLSLIKPVCHTEPVADETSSPQAIRISAQDLVSIMDVLFKNPDTFFDMLSCITGIDNGVQAATMEVVYNLYSIPFHHHLMIKVTLPRENQELIRFATSGGQRTGMSGKFLICMEFILEIILTSEEF